MNQAEEIARGMEAMKRRLERITVPAAAMAEGMDESPSAHVAATLGGSEEEEVDQRRSRSQIK